MALINLCRGVKMSKDQITLYGADWCGDCRRSKRLLAELNVEYTLVDVEHDLSAADKVKEINGEHNLFPLSFSLMERI